MTERLTAADYRRQYGPQTAPPRAARTTPPPPPAPAPKRPAAAPKQAQKQPVANPAYGIVAYAHFAGVRFVATDVPAALAEALAALCEAHGVRPASTAHFLTASASH